MRARFRGNCRKAQSRAVAPAAHPVPQLIPVPHPFTSLQYRSTVDIDPLVKSQYGTPLVSQERGRHTFTLAERENSRVVSGVCDSLIKYSTTLELLLVCSRVSHLLVLKNRGSFLFGNFILVSPPHKQAKLYLVPENNDGSGPFSFKFFVPMRVGRKGAVHTVWTFI